MSASRAPLAAAPTGPVSVPAAVRHIAANDAITPVWQNSLGGTTFQLAASGGGPGDIDRFVKWVPAGTPELDLADEAQRLAWARAHGARVPEVIDYASSDAGSWLVTRAVGDGAPGPAQFAAQSAVSDRWRDSPRRAARVLGEGLRELHERLPVAECPFSWSVEDRLEQVHERFRRGDGPETWSPEYRGLSPEHAFALLADAPPMTSPVVCHGDACAPNTLLTHTGGFAAHVDLGELGVADPWADLAIAAWSTEWNFGPGFEAEVYAGYGVAPDHDRIAYYRLLWDLS